jgi:two-component system chemotaxis response regulator CheY
MSKVILAVDDSASARVMIRGTLRGTGYQLIEAADGDEALVCARDHVVDLVLVDLYMPRMDGITLIQQLRGLPSYNLTPILMLTTESSHERKQQAKQAGATGWIVKPFAPTQLLEAIERVFKPAAPLP